MKYSARILTAATPLLFSSVAQAADRPDFNAYHDAAPAASAAQSGVSSEPAVVASVDAKRGVPTFLWAGRGPHRAGVRARGTSPEAAARRALAAQAGRYGLSRAALGAAEVTQVHDLGRGGVLVVMRQRVNGVELFHNDVKVLMDRGLDLVAIGGNLYQATQAPRAAGFLLSEPEAIAAAFKDLYGIAADVTDANRTKGGYRCYDLVNSPAVSAAQLHFVRPARIKRVFFPMPERLVPAYFVELLSGKDTETTSDAYDFVIAADDGRLLYRQNLTHADSFSYRVFADPSGDHRPTDGPLADHTPHPTGRLDGSYPSFVGPSLVSIDGFNRSRDPWLPRGATATTGNNVDAYTDDDAPDGYSSGDLRATVTRAGVFDRVYDTGAGPQSSNGQRMAAITDLFYVTNWLHDWWYDSGFDEAAGNAQAHNFGRGGIEGDPLRAEGQDAAPRRRNNANMTVTADGESPRMQMFVWDGPSTSLLGVQPFNQHLPHGTAAFGPQSFDVRGALVLADDGEAPRADACTPLVDAGAVKGKIALVERGACSFTRKVANAEAAGAVGVILFDNRADELPPPMSGGDSTGELTTPVLSVTQRDGEALEAALAGGTVMVTMNRSRKPDRDGTLDNTVIAHEWGHYMHLRQVACSSPACHAESEGWGDLVALLMMVREGDDLDGAFAIGQYATGAFQDDPGYFGIRRYPYSVDFTKNPLTFKHISDGEPLPTTAPVSQAAARANNAESHAAGEIWASMLFEGYIALLKQSLGASPRYSFDEARRRMSDYVVAGIKLAPADPTFTEQRDAVLAAAAASDPRDLEILAQAFARRGAGTCAVSPKRWSKHLSGVVESYAVQPNVSVLSATLDDGARSCDDRTAGGRGEVTVKIVNAGPVPIAHATGRVVSKSEGVTFPAGDRVTFDDVGPFATATASVEVASSPTKQLKLEVTMDDVRSCDGTSSTVVVAKRSGCSAPRSADAASIQPLDSSSSLEQAPADDAQRTDDPALDGGCAVTGGSPSGAPLAAAFAMTATLVVRRRRRRRRR